MSKRNCVHTTTSDTSSLSATSEPLQSKEEFVHKGYLPQNLLIPVGTSRSHVRT